MSNLVLVRAMDHLFLSKVVRSTLPIHARQRARGSRTQEWRRRRFRRHGLHQVHLWREKQMVKRSVGALGLLGLVYAVALPAAHAATLWQPDLSKDKLEGVNGIYVQGVSGTDGDRGTDTTLGEGPFIIDHDANEV